MSLGGPNTSEDQYERVRKENDLEDFQRKVIQIMICGTCESEIFDFIYENLKNILPYDRMAIGLIENSDCIRLHWVRSEMQINHLKHNYRSALSHSSLENVMLSGKPRILNDLEEYLSAHPQSASTQLALLDGIRSSLTCPLVANNKAVGFLFFSSTQKGTFIPNHIQEFLKISECLSLIIDHTHLMQTIKENQVTQLGLGRVAHDLRSPLSIFKMTLDFLTSQSWFKSLDLQNTKYFEILVRNCKVMLQMVDDLDVASQIGKGVFTLKKEDVHIKSFFEDILSSAKILAEQKKIQLALQMCPSTTEFGFFDPHRLRQAIMNLITNSVKFSSRETHVTIKTSLASEQRLLVTVCDQGAGIPEKELSLLFHDFGKTSVKPTHGEGSTGLGLSIVKKIIDAHDGDIRVKTKPGIGSEFSFQIPIIATRH